MTHEGAGKMGVGYTHGPACRRDMTVNLASLQSRDGVRRVFAEVDSQSLTKHEAL